MFLLQMHPVHVALNHSTSFFVLHIAHTVAFTLPLILFVLSPSFLSPQTESSLVSFPRPLLPWPRKSSEWRPPLVGPSLKEPRKDLFLFFSHTCAAFPRSILLPQPESTPQKSSLALSQGAGAENSPGASCTRSHGASSVPFLLLSPFRRTYAHTRSMNHRGDVVPRERAQKRRAETIAELPLKIGI